MIPIPRAMCRRHLVIQRCERALDVIVMASARSVVVGIVKGPEAVEVAVNSLSSNRKGVQYAPDFRRRLVAEVGVGDAHVS